MRKLIVITLALAVCILMVSFSAEAKKSSSTKPVPKKTSPAKSSETSKLKTIAGKVASVNTGAQAITLSAKTKGKEEKTLVLLNEKTSIVMGKEKRMLGDLKKGDDLSVQYEVVDGKNMAKNITVISAKVSEKK